MQRAMREVRSGSAKLGIAPDRIGVMGLAVAEHLSAMAPSRAPGRESEWDDSRIAYRRTIFSDSMPRRALRVSTIRRDESSKPL